MTTEKVQAPVQVALRLDADVAEAIELRLADLLATHGVKMSRNEWINKCARWALHELPYGADKRTKLRAVSVAPEDVTGTEKYDMGLGTIEGKGSLK